MNENSAEQRKPSENERQTYRMIKKKFANHISGKGLISKIYKELLLLDSNKNGQRI